MKVDSMKDQVSRRGFLGVSSAALVATVGGLSAANAVAQDKQVNAGAAKDRNQQTPGRPTRPWMHRILIPSGHRRRIRRA
jgi:anaerobic selenocysteine-containing dehydrogenase